MFFTAAAFVSCADELDINNDPTSPNQITPALALASAEASIVTVVGGEFTNLGGFYAQYQTQSPSAGQYETMDQYNLNATYSNRLWAELYAGGLNDLEFVITESEKTGDTGTILIATCLKAYTFQLLVDLFGDVPYTEALQGLGNITPAPTPGQEVYADLILKIDAAIAAYNANPVESEVGSQDMIYGGDTDNWLRFANTLKLKMYLRMAYTAQANPAAVNALIAEDNFIDEDAAFTNFNKTLDKTNPFYGVQISSQGSGLGDVNNIASNTLMEFYVANNDQRKELVYRPSNTGAYVSLPQGAGDEFNNTALNYSRPNINPEFPVFLMTLAESNFLQAEALIRYAGGTGAKAKYDAGVVASFITDATYFLLDDDRDGITEPSDTDQIWEPIYNTTEALGFANALIAGGGAYEYVDAGSVEGNVRQVIIQKWAALAFVNNIEAYIETTRTKYPEVVPEGTENYAIGNRIPSRISVLSGTTVPSILLYPEQEVNRNPNITQKGSQTEKVWWDQK